MLGDTPAVLTTWTALPRAEATMPLGKLMHILHGMAFGGDAEPAVFVLSRPFLLHLALGAEAAEFGGAADGVGGGEAEVVGGEPEPEAV